MSGEQYQPPSGPPPGWRQQNLNEQYQPPAGPPPGKTQQRLQEQYQAPAGPPPGWHARQQPEERYQPPSGPPPAWSPSHSQTQYAPPSGPPPGYGSASGSSQHETYAPPPGPPPSNAPAQDPPPNHDWTVIPDTSLLPPPPSIGYDKSPTANASSDEGAYAFNWCLERPLWHAQQLSPDKIAAVQRGEITLVKPTEFSGDVTPQTTRPGTWRCRSKINCRDSCLQAFPPLYSALNDTPLQTGKSKTVYFELHMYGIADQGTTAQQKPRFGFGRRTQEEAEAGIAIGFFAPPFPTWRLPGWQRGSLGVHGDDGRRYVNDTYGGLDFTSAFKVGETVGVGITYSIPTGTPPYGLEAHVFFTRNGEKDGGWDLHEELDEKIKGGVKGMEGDFDLYAAVGVFGAADFEIRFSAEQWMFNPY